MKSSEGGLSVIVRAGDYESVHYALALAAAALAVNKPAVLFFTMAGIHALAGPPPASTTGRVTLKTASAASATSRPCCRPASSLARASSCAKWGCDRSASIARACAAMFRSPSRHRDLA